MDRGDGSGRCCSRTHSDIRRYLLVSVLLLGMVTTAMGDPGTSPPAVRAHDSANPLPCYVSGVVVRSPDEVDASDACAGAAHAIGFLKAHGLELSGDVQIDILPELYGHARHSAAGTCLEAERRVLILNYARFREFGTWFKVPIDRDLYRSLAAHEVAHAVAACNFRIPKPSLQAKEYIAYVTQLSTMEPAQRERVLAQFPGEGFESDLQMNATIYLFDPMRFGVQAYRHFLKPGHGTGYLHAVVAGEALETWQMPGY